MPLDEVKAAPVSSMSQDDAKKRRKQILEASRHVTQCIWYQWSYGHRVWFSEQSTDDQKRLAAKQMDRIHYSSLPWCRIDFEKSSPLHWYDDEDVSMDEDADDDAEDEPKPKLMYHAFVASRGKET